METLLKPKWGTVPQVFLELVAAMNCIIKPLPHVKLSGVFPTCSQFVLGLCDSAPLAGSCDYVWHSLDQDISPEIIQTTV